MNNELINTHQEFVENSSKIINKSNISENLNEIFEIIKNDLRIKTNIILQLKKELKEKDKIIKKYKNKDKNKNRFCELTFNF